VSLIRKPVAAERESRSRHVAEEVFEATRKVQNASDYARRGASKAVLALMLVGFTFGAITASSLGAQMLGLLIMAPFWYFAWRHWSSNR
jgi:hypothetical protein